MTQHDTTPADRAVTPACRDAEGCHRVIVCDPGCGAAGDLLRRAATPQPADRADLRDRITGARQRLFGVRWADTEQFGAALDEYTAAVLRDFVRELGDRLLGCCQECNACAAIARDLAAEMTEDDAVAQPAQPQTGGGE